MASRRLLNFSRNHSTLLALFCGLLLGSLIIAGCGTTEEAQRQPGPGANNTADDRDAAAAAGVSEEFLAVLNTNRSMLSDVYSSLEYDIPELFRKESKSRDVGDPYQGYRIQILSTRNVNNADSLANDFRFWADSVMTNHVPKAYVLFRQPYYKVHVGNFHFQDQALKLNQMIKDRYPDAWVVHDNVEPNLVPPDTVSFSDNN